MTSLDRNTKLTFFKPLKFYLNPLFLVLILVLQIHCRRIQINFHLDVLYHSLSPLFCFLSKHYLVSAHEISLSLHSADLTANIQYIQNYHNQAMPSGRNADMWYSKMQIRPYRLIANIWLTSLISLGLKLKL